MDFHDLILGSYPTIRMGTLTFAGYNSLTCTKHQLGAMQPGPMQFLTSKNLNLEVVKNIQLFSFFAANTSSLHCNIVTNLFHKIFLHHINPFMTEAVIIWTGFYMITVSVMKGLRSYFPLLKPITGTLLTYCLHCSFTSPGSI